MHFYSLKPPNQSAQFSVFQPDLAINANPTFGFLFGLSMQSLKIHHRERASGCQYFLFFFFSGIFSNYCVSRWKPWLAENRCFFKSLPPAIQEYFSTRSVTGPSMTTTFSDAAVLSCHFTCVAPGAIWLLTWFPAKHASRPPGSLPNPARARAPAPSSQWFVLQLRWAGRPVLRPGAQPLSRCPPGGPRARRSVGPREVKQAEFPAALGAPNRAGPLESGSPDKRSRGRRKARAAAARGDGRARRPGAAGAVRGTGRLRVAAGRRSPGSRGARGGHEAAPAAAAGGRHLLRVPPLPRAARGAGVRVAAVHRHQQDLHGGAQLRGPGAPGHRAVRQPRCP